MLTSGRQRVTRAQVDVAANDLRSVEKESEKPSVKSCYFIHKENGMMSPGGTGGRKQIVGAMELPHQEFEKAGTAVFSTLLQLHHAA